MHKKYLVCVHDKKSDSYDAFMLFDNLTQAARAFQQTCENNEIFKKWPKDFEFILVNVTTFQNGAIDELGNQTENAKILGTQQHDIVIAQAADYVAIEKAKNEKK